MTKADDADGLRADAEARLQARSVTETATAAATKADQLRLLHELQVHQVELEMQNEELRQSRAELEAALTRYTELYDFAPVGYLTLTADGLIAELNLTGAKLLGGERGNLKKRRFASFVTHADQNRWAGFFLSVKSHEEQGHQELELQRGDGTTFHAQMDCVRHRVMGSGPSGVGADATANFPAGTLLEVSIALTDISVRKRVEAKLNEAMVAAEKANRAKTDFLSSMSHELRTPLNAILGFAQLMRMDCDDESQSEAAEYLDEILLASRHLNQLLGEILEWSSLQNEPAQLELQAVDVCKLMRECAELVSLEVQQRGLHLQLQLPDEPLQVLAEPRRLRQVLLNLLSNAMKYNVPDGHISLRTETSPGHVRLLVEDTGLGIEPAQQAQVFEPFQRLGRENSMIQGTGIGLSRCLEFARLMNGQLGLHSEPGVGSRFWIELPRLAPAALQ